MKPSVMQIDRINNRKEEPIKLEDETIENTTSFAGYLGSVRTVDGATMHDVMTRIGKAMTLLLVLIAAWRSKEKVLRRLHLAVEWCGNVINYKRTQGSCPGLCYQSHALHR